MKYGRASKPRSLRSVLSILSIFLFCLTYAGLALGDNWEKILGVIRYLDIVVVLAVIAIIIWLIIRKSRKRNQQKALQ